MSVGAQGSAVSDPQHPARLLRALSSFREEGRFCDAHLVLEGEEIPVQTNILAAASPYISEQEFCCEYAEGTLFINLDDFELSPGFSHLK
ncbi:UNVERIFIED_CONTAM: hypothetical protein K2H54_047613 [Gekko kuhli]